MQPKHESNDAVSFYGLGIAPKILEILSKIRFKTPTPIQRQAIPLAVEGKDVIGIAQTGTGKTHAFAIPMVQHLAQKGGMAIVLAPTRELATQIDEAVKILARAFGIRTALLIGGAAVGPQTDALRRKAQIVIATPGRFIDHMEQRNIQMGKVIMLVIDEADRMLDMGFAPQVEQILKAMPRDRQTMLFSATMPAEIMRMVQLHMKLPTHVEIAPPGTTAEHITQELYIVNKESKMKLLDKILKQYQGSVILFIRTKHQARKITRSIRDFGHNAVEIHSDRTLGQRRQALDGFKSGRYRILVATDIASRGIDVTHIELVINYDLPDEIENYVHRIGRTGRAGNKGRAISFAMPDQRDDIRKIERLIRMELPVLKHPEVETYDREQSYSSPPPSRQGNFRYGKMSFSSRDRARAGRGRFRRR